MIRNGRLVTPQRGWAWVVPFVLAGFGPSLGSSTGLGLGLVLAVGLFAGADWHWLNRRDVTARLTIPSFLVFLQTFSLAFEDETRPVGEQELVGMIVFWTSVMVGVVLMERLMRWREREAWRSPDDHVTAPAET